MLQDRPKQLLTQKFEKKNEIRILMYSELCNNIRDKEYR